MTYKDIPVSLDADTWQQLITTYLAQTISPASMAVFEEACSIAIEQALLRAIRNEAARAALHEAINDAGTPVSGIANKTTYIWVKFQKEGIHCYPAAATDPNLATGDQYDVSFLASPHRHIFHFRVGIEVFHDDRDIEFIQFKRWLEALYANGTLELNHKSCEMISDDLYTAINGRYPGRTVHITVSEDDENGATTTYPA